MEFQIGDKGETPTIFTNREQNHVTTHQDRQVDRQEHDLVQEMQQRSLQP